MTIEAMGSTRERLAFGQHDRMRKTLHVTGTTVEEMADYLGVSRNSVSNWINGRIKPGKQTVMLWASHFDVPVSWIVSGEWPETEEAPASSEDETEASGVVRPKGFEPLAF